MTFQADAEAVADFKMMVGYFWMEKGDPERFTGWDEDYCARVWPEFLQAWRQYKNDRAILNALVRVSDDLADSRKVSDA
jgi:hypothetical protein